MDSSESDNYTSITNSDVFWDGSHLSNPSVSEVLPATAGISGPRPITSVLGAGSSVPVTGATMSTQDLGPGGHRVGMVTSCAVVTSTFSRPINSSGSMNPTPGQAMGVNFLGNTRTPVVSSASFSGFTLSQLGLHLFHTPFLLDHSLTHLLLVILGISPLLLQLPGLLIRSKVGLSLCRILEISFQSLRFP